MTVLIENIQMPKEGSVLVIDSCGKVWSSIWPTGYIKVDQAKAVEVPTPHGDLIDANETVAQLQEMIDVVEEVYPLDGRERQLGIERGLRDARRFIVELAPIIIEAEK